MLIGDLSGDALALRLRGEGLHLNTGAFTTRLHIELPRLVREFADMYAQYTIEDPPGIDDARLRIAPPSLVRRYLIPEAGAWIDGRKLFDPVPAARAYTALESGMNWAVASSEVAPLLLHAAVVERDGSALIMPAATGSGKSTLCAALVWRGWRLFSDEMAVFSLDGGTMLPNPRPVSLKNRGIDAIAAFEPRARFSPTYRGTPKGDIAYMRPPANAIMRARESALPSLVLAPDYREGAAVTLRKLDKAQGFRWLIDNAVNYSSKLRAGFEIITEVVERCRFYVLTYSDLEEAVDTVNRLLGESSAGSTP